MITMTEAARDKIAEIMEVRGQCGCALRLMIVGRGADDFKYDMRFVDSGMVVPEDTALDMGRFTLVVDPASALNLAGTVIDFRGLSGGGGLLIDNPNPVWTDETARAVALIIEKHINPGVQAHGGYVNLLDVKDGVVTITMNGGCQGCGLAAMTLRFGIEQMIKEAVPSIREIVDATEHARGTNPFFPREGASGQSPVAKQ
jgi:Fe/S biogenesis protein NfuA